MSDNDDDDERKRRRAATTAGELAAELLRKLGLPVPDNIDEIIERGPVDPPPPPPEPQIDRAAQLRFRADRMIEGGWPTRAVEFALAADEHAVAIQRIGEFDGAGALVLSGDVGVGKTVAAAWWSLRQMRPMMFVRAATLARTSRYDAEAWSRFVTARSLCIDDLGAEFADVKGSFAVDLDELIDTFYANKRPLIVTTNCKAGVFKMRYGARVLDRLSESGKWVNVTGTSMRGAT